MAHHVLITVTPRHSNVAHGQNSDERVV